MNCCRHKYFVIYRGDDTDFPGNQELIVEINTTRDLTGCSAHFQFQGFTQDFDEIPSDKKLRLVIPNSETGKFALGAADAKLWLTNGTKVRTVESRIHIVVTNRVDEAYDNDDPQAITVTISGGGGGATVVLDDTVTETSSNGVKSSGIWSWVKSLLPHWLTSDYAEPATAASVKAKADKATTLAGYGITDAVPFVEDLEGFKTAVKIGTRIGTAGPYSLSNGELAYAIGKSSHAEGFDTIAFAPYSYAGGVTVQTLEEHPFSYVWNGDETMPAPYTSHGPGTFNINPVGGTDGFYIGEQTLPQVINAAITGKANLAALAPEYSATSAYSVGAIVYHDGSIYQCKTAIADGGEAWNAEHWELRKLDGFFTESNSLLTGTIDARLPYPLNAVTDETGLLKDRAINTTSLASVTVPDNFTDLLVRASVASSLSVTMPEAIATKYGDTFPGEAGEYLITITKTGAAEAYVRTIKLEEVA